MRLVWDPKRKSEEIRIGLVGCGGRGTSAAHEALKTSKAVKLVALDEVFEDRLNRAYENLKKTYRSQVEVADSKKFMGFDAYQNNRQLRRSTLGHTATVPAPIS